MLDAHAARRVPGPVCNMLHNAAFSFEHSRHHAHAGRVSQACLHSAGFQGDGSLHLDLGTKTQDMGAEAVMQTAAGHAHLVAVNLTGSEEAGEALEVGCWPPMAPRQHMEAKPLTQCPVLLPAAGEMRPCAAPLAHALPVRCLQKELSASSASAGQGSEDKSIADDEQSSQPSPSGSAEPHAGQRPGRASSPSPSRDTTAECSQDGADEAEIVEEEASADMQVMPDGSS